MKSFDRYYLVDNGSLRAASYLNLARWAEALSIHSGREVLPTSLLHSNRIDPKELGGTKALTWEPQLKKDFQSGARRFCVLPFFIGPTAAITQYIPDRVKALRAKLGPFELHCGPFIGGKPEMPTIDLLDILQGNILEGLNRHQLSRPRVVLVDHGSPQRPVARLRDRTAEELQARLGDLVTAIRPASMERREGDEYAFNEPLLETVLAEEGWNQGAVLIALLFLSPGRHAGPEGDITGICRQAEENAPGLRTCMTPLIGDHPDLLPLLHRRLLAAEEAVGSGL